MITEDEKVFTVDSNIQGEKINLQIAPEAMQHIMTVLTKLYSDDETAIIREYSTNALDAHVEAGVTRPIEVTTPTALAPFLRIKDYGIGMTVEDIHDIYSRYGASTKRNTNDQVGMLGLGCKSALAYTNQFTLVAVKDGIKVQAMIGRDEDGGGSITIVDTSTTSEGNGVEIIIPAKRGNLIERKAQRFFSYWPADKVLLNENPPPVLFTEKSLKISDRITMAWNVNNAIVMGNVPYPIDEATRHLLGSIPHGYGIVVRVDIGDISFVPSREALHYTKKTIETLTTIGNEFDAGLMVAIQSEINNQPDKSEALKAYYTWYGLIDSMQNLIVDFAYKGENIPVQFSLPPKKIEVIDAKGKKTKRLVAQRMLTVSKSYSRIGESSRRPAIPSSWWKDCVFFYGKKDLVWHANNRKRLDMWRDDHPLVFGSSIYVVLEDKPTELDGWVPDNRIVDFSEVEAYTLKKVAKPVDPMAGAYDCISPKTKYACRILPEDLAKESNIFWIHGNSSDAYGHGFVDLLWEKFGANSWIICLPANRLDKFHKTFPEAKELKATIKGLYDSWYKTLTTDDIDAIALIRYSYSWENLARLDENKIDDPDIKNSIRVAKHAKKINKKLWKDFLSFRGTFRDIDTEVGSKTAARNHETIMQSRYPHIGIGNLSDDRRLDEFGTYAEYAHVCINALYAARESKKNNTNPKKGI